MKIHIEIELYNEAIPVLRQSVTLNLLSPKNMTYLISVKISWVVPIIYTKVLRSTNYIVEEQIVIIIIMYS